MDGTDGTLSQLGSPQESNASFLRSPKIFQLMPLSTNTKKFDRQIGNISVLNVNSDHALQMMFCPQLRDINPKRKLPKFKYNYEKGLKAYIHGQWLLNTNAKTNQDIQSENLGDLYFYYCDKNLLIDTFHKHVTKYKE